MAFNEDTSFIEYNVEQPTQDFVTNFDTIGGTTDVVLVTVDGVLTDTPESSYTVQQINHTTWRVTPEVQAGSVVRLYRVTNIDEMMHVFTAGAKFIARNMDSNFKQIRHAQQEVRDGFDKLSTDTNEIIRTLEDVAQSAQAAADSAESAAQTANDAAAQVNDKVSYQDLDNAVEAAVTPVVDYIALPFKVGKSYGLYERVQLTNGDIVQSVVAGNTADPNIDMTGWVNTSSPYKITVLVDDFLQIGEVDYTGAIQRASDYVGELGGGTVNFMGGKTYEIGRSSPSGDYNYSILLKHSNLRFEGNGATIKLRDTQDCTMIRTAFGIDGQSSMLSKFVFNNLTLDGNWDGQTWAGPTGKESEGIYDQNGLSIYAVSEVEFNNVHVYNVAQDSFACASCDTVRYNNCSSINSGKNNFQCFLSHDVVYNDCYASYSNASPDESTKPIYTTSTDRYSAFGGSGASTLLDNPVYSGISKLNFQRNLIRYNSCKAVTKNGRGFSLLYNMNDVTYNSCAVFSEGSRHGFSFSFSANNKRSNVKLNSCEYINKSVTGTNSRAISATNLKNISVRDFVIETESTTNNYAAATFINCAEFLLSDFRSSQETGAATPVAADIRGCTKASINNAKGVGSISFSSAATTKAVVLDSDMPVTGKALVTQFSDDSRLRALQFSQVLIGTSVDGEQFLDVTVPATGANFGDFTEFSFSNLPANLDKFIVSAFVSSTNTVTVRFRNLSNTAVAIGSTTIYVSVVAR